jgi:hypothetical protein
MISGISYGTYLIFGILTFIGAGFIHFLVPETKRLTLEEMNVIFGSEGTAQADFERMDEINKEIGLERIARDAGGYGSEHLSEKNDKEIEVKEE